MIGDYGWPSFQNPNAMFSQYMQPTGAIGAEEAYPGASQAPMMTADQGTPYPSRGLGMSPLEQLQMQYWKNVVAQTAPPAPPPPWAQNTMRGLGLGLGVGGLAGIGQNLFGQPGSPFTPQALNFLKGSQGQFAQARNLIANPRIPPELAMLAETALQPQLGSLYSQATEAGRRRGFHSGPAESPAGGAILGPGLADYQGQLAALKANLYQQQVMNMLNSAGAQGRIATAMPQRRPRPSILQTMGEIVPLLGMLSGIFKGFA